MNRYCDSAAHLCRAKSLICTCAIPSGNNSHENLNGPRKPKSNLCETFTPSSMLRRASILGRSSLTMFVLCLALARGCSKRIFFAPSSLISSMSTSEPFRLVFASSTFKPVGSLRSSSASSSSNRTFYNGKTIFSALLRFLGVATVADTSRKPIHLAPEGENANEDVVAAQSIVRSMLTDRNRYFFQRALPTKIILLVSPSLQAISSRVA